MAEQGTPLATKGSYQPLAPIGSAGQLKGLLESQARGIAQTLPKHITPERLIKTMLVAANRIPDLLKCTQASIMETINRAAELGLDLSGTLGEAYPLPFNNKVKDANGTERWVQQCQLIIGYRGMEKLAWQSGEVQSIDAEVVYKGDKFVFKKGTEVLVEWTPCMDGERGEALGAYACVSMKSGGKIARFITKADIEKIRSKSKSGNSPAWRDWWDEMARKCALKRTLKDAPLSTEKYAQAMEHEETDMNLTDVLEVSPIGQELSAGKKAFGFAGKKKPEFIEQAPPQQEPAQGETVDPQTGEVTGGEQQQETAQNDGQGQSEAAGAGPDLSTWPAFLEAMGEVAQAKSIAPTKLTGGINMAVLAAKLKGKEAQIPVEWKRQHLAAFTEGRLNLDTGKIAPAAQ
jgi:recombination protein RecT